MLRVAFAAPGPGPWAVAWLVTVPGRGVRPSGVARLRLGQAGGTGSAREYAAAAARVLAGGVRR